MFATIKRTLGLSERIKYQPPPFPGPSQTVNREGGHVYQTLAGRMRQANVGIDLEVPAVVPADLKKLMAREYPLYLSDAVWQWVTRAALAGGEPDPLKAHGWFVRTYGFKPEQEVARHMAWLAFQVLA